ncbi:MAG TPA: polyphosphate kinase 2, partial [Aliarcobacter thereius]|nr:polyphosphate kinase 2 [Aliarcobacter thereius]
MTLSDFDITNHSGLYVSKEPHPTFGKKYIARFQYDKKRYVKVLGYEKRDNITLKDAKVLIESFRATIMKKIDTINLKQEEKKPIIKNINSSSSEELKKLKEENSFLKSILKDYKKL